jgi:hypothetical protein
MDDIIEISELDIGGDNFKKSVSFGSGIELLMNDKVKDSAKPKSDIDLDDLTKLEQELNGLVEEPLTFSEPIGLGKSTMATASEPKTWDGFGKFNNVPINPDVSFGSGTTGQSGMSKDEMLREKFKLLRQLESLEKKGVELSKKYSMESSLMEMQGEYETIMDEKRKQNSVKFQGNMLMAAINGLEFLNGRFDPFDIKLDGWSEQINENITDYDEIFGELHEKYQSKASLAPELKLLFQLGGSAMMVHMTNTMFKSAMPGMDDIMRQNPDLMRSFQTAAVNSMSQSSPGLSGFMNNMMNSDVKPQRGMGPPPPMATQEVRPPAGRPGNNDYARNDMKQQQNDLRNEKQSTQRKEMKGPSDISDILSGLKTKTINIQETNTMNVTQMRSEDNDANLAKKSGRRKKSASNTVSLDI